MYLPSSMIPPRLTLCYVNVIAQKKEGAKKALPLIYNCSSILRDLSFNEAIMIKMLLELNVTEPRILQKLDPLSP
jgi:hypothetical protein